MSSSRPRYMQQTASSSLPDYWNREQDVINSIFSKASYRNIQNLPDKIKSEAVLDAIHKHAQANLQSSPKKSATAPITAPVPISSPPVLTNQSNGKKKKKKRASKNKLHSSDGAIFLNPNVFQYSTARPQPISPLQGKPETLPEPFVVDLLEEKQRQEAAFQRNRILYGPFRPSGFAYDVLDRRSLPDILQDLRNKWEAEKTSKHKKTGLTVSSDEDDLIILKFQNVTESQDLIQYMNQLDCKDNLMSQNKLSKVVECWGLPDISTSCHCFYFALRPSWVKASKLEAYYLLHPEYKFYHSSNNNSSTTTTFRQKQLQQRRSSQPLPLPSHKTPQLHVLTNNNSPNPLVATKSLTNSASTTSISTITTPTTATTTTTTTTTTTSPSSSLSSAATTATTPTTIKANNNKELFDVHLAATPKKLIF